MINKKRRKWPKGTKGKVQRMIAEYGVDSLTAMLHSGERVYGIGPITLTELKKQLDYKPYPVGSVFYVQKIHGAKVNYKGEVEPHYGNRIVITEHQLTVVNNDNDPELVCTDHRGNEMTVTAIDLSETYQGSLDVLAIKLKALAQKYREKADQLWSRYNAKASYWDQYANKGIAAAEVIAPESIRKAG